MGALRALAPRIYSESRSWGGFIDGFKERGLEVAPKGGGLVLKDGADGRELCKMSALGLSYKQMVQGFEDGFSGRPSPSMADDALGTKRAGAPKRQRRSKPSDKDDDFDIMEA